MKHQEAPRKKLLAPPVDRMGYSDRAAWILASCSSLAYQDQKKDLAKLKKGLGAFGLRLARQFHCKKNQNSGYLAVHPTYAVLAFKGTVPGEITTVETDLNFWFVQTRYGEVHQGFLDAYLDLAGQIETALGKLKVPIYVTGHSLGGALALLASIFLNDKRELGACYTYGCPRVGNDQFASHLFKVPVYRCFHRADIVPGLPFFAMGYRAYGDVRFLSDDNRVCEGSEAVYKRFQAFLDPFNWSCLISDHMIDRYTRILHEFAKSRNQQAPSERRTIISRRPAIPPPK